MNYIFGTLVTLLLMFLIVLGLEILQNFALPKGKRKPIRVLLAENSIASSSVLICAIVLVVIKWVII